MGAGKGSRGENHMFTGMLGFVVAEQWKLIANSMKTVEEMQKNGDHVSGCLCCLLESSQPAMTKMDMLRNLLAELDWFYVYDVFLSPVKVRLD